MSETARLGEHITSKIAAPGGTITIQAEVEAGPALAVTVESSNLPVYVRRGLSAARIAMEIRMLNGARYFALTPSDYSRTAARQPELAIRPMTRLEDDRPPTWLVFTDDGDPAVMILAGYITGVPGVWTAYEPGGMRLRPSQMAYAEQGLIGIARNRETLVR